MSTSTGVEDDHHEHAANKLELDEHGHRHGRRRQRRRGPLQDGRGVQRQNPCTTDACVHKQCENTPLADGTAVRDPQTTGDCKLDACEGGHAKTINDDGDKPTSANAITTGDCNNGTPTTKNQPTALCVARPATACARTGCASAAREPRRLRHRERVCLVHLRRRSLQRARRGFRAGRSKTPNDCQKIICDSNGGRTSVAGQAPTLRSTTATHRTGHLPGRRSVAPRRDAGHLVRRQQHLRLRYEDLLHADLPGHRVQHQVRRHRERQLRRSPAYNCDTSNCAGGDRKCDGVSGQCCARPHQDRLQGPNAAGWCRTVVISSATAARTLVAARSSATRPATSAARRRTDFGVR